MDKYNLLRKQARPLRMSSELNLDIISLLPFVLFTYALLGYVFFNYLGVEKEVQTVMLVAVGFTAAFIILPVSKVADLCVENPVHIFEKNYSGPELYYLEKADEF